MASSGVKNYSYSWAESICWDTACKHLRVTRGDSLLALQDEQSALVMVKKHQTLEQALEDYAQTIHQLSNSSRLMVTSEHPER